jgi:hypothetical protein
VENTKPPKSDKSDIFYAFFAILFLFDIGPSETHKNHRGNYQAYS